MDRYRGLMRLVLNDETMEIMRLAVEEGMYPSQIATKLGKSKSFVVKKLNELEGYGIIKSRFSRRQGSVVKKFQLVVEEFTLKVNLKLREVKLEEKRRKAMPTERIRELL
jgi:predicted transcriptional regulator